MVAEINHYAISKILGSRMEHVKQGRFGSFPLLETTAEMLCSREGVASASGTPSFSYEQDRLVVRAFEEVRHGAAPDAILWDKALAQEFYRRCHELGLAAPDAFLGRRLLNVRKNSPRYERHGIKISPTTASEIHPSIVPQYAHVIEFALVWLRYRVGASIDDILLDPDLGSRFEELTSHLAPELDSQQLRLGALYIRKTRYIQRGAIEVMKALDMRSVEGAWSAPVPLAAVSPEEVPLSPGLIDIMEGPRHLYVSRNDNLQAAATQIRTGRAFDIVANGFWTPNLARITLRVAVGERFGGHGVAVWERRLIHDLEPVFNWPMQKKAA
jgi:hypothetical protein